MQGLGALRTLRCQPIAFYDSAGDVFDFPLAKMKINKVPVINMIREYNAGATVIAGFSRRGAVITIPNVPF